MNRRDFFENCARISLSYLSLNFSCTDRDFNDSIDFIDNINLDNPSYNPCSALCDTTDIDNGAWPSSIVESENLVNGSKLIGKPAAYLPLEDRARLEPGIFPTPGVIVRYGSDITSVEGFADSGAEIWVKTSFDSYGIDLDDVCVFAVYRYNLNKLNLQSKSKYPIGWPPKFNLIQPDTVYPSAGGILFNIDEVLKRYGPTREVGIFFFGEHYDFIINGIKKMDIR